MRVTGDSAGAFVCGPVDVLQASGVAFSVQEHAPVIGQVDAERVLGLSADQMLKTMVFRAGAATMLVALPARSRVHYGNLAKGGRRAEERAAPGRTGRSGAHRHDAWRGEPRLRRGRGDHRL
jgi:hypothetical protein